MGQGAEGMGQGARGRGHGAWEKEGASGCGGEGANATPERCSLRMDSPEPGLS